MHKRKDLSAARQKFLAGIGVPGPAPFVVDSFQSEAIQSVIDGHDTLVVAPTGSGKTYIATEAIQTQLLLGGRAIYTTPLKALSNTKFTEFKLRFEPSYSVGLLTGDRKIEGDSSLVIATTEIFRNELYRFSERYSLVILDEIHFISDSQRGPVWEESIILAPASSTLLMLSASISNAQEIADWLEFVRKKPCKIIIKKERPVELRMGFLHPDLGILPLFEDISGRSGRVFPEVLSFYGSQGLESDGLRLRGSHGSGSRSGRSFGDGQRSGRGSRNRARSSDRRGRR